MVLLTKLITPDGTELVSRHRHHYVVHHDKNGKMYMVDGGGEYYYRASCNGDEKIIQVTTEDDFEVIRENYALFNNHIQSYVLLKDISDDWLQNIIDWYIMHNYKGKLLFLHIEEKLYRAEKEYSVPELKELKYAT